MLLGTKLPKFRSIVRRHLQSQTVQGVKFYLLLDPEDVCMRSFETSVNSYQPTQRNTPEDLRLQLPYCETLRYSFLLVLVVLFLVLVLLLLLLLISVRLFFLLTSGEFLFFTA